MDKIKLTAEDIDKLFAWRDEHKDLVRLYPTVLEAIEIKIYSGLSFKAIAEGSKITFHVFYNGRKVGKLEWKKAPFAMRLMKNSSKLPYEATQGTLTTYCSLMAYMAYAKENVERVPRKSATHRAGTKQLPSPSTHFTYILHHKSESKATGGHHRSPQGVFSVRGHFRQYKSGKRVWIEPYKKGTGNKKDKEYKM